MLGRVACVRANFSSKQIHLHHVNSALVPGSLSPTDHVSTHWSLGSEHFWKQFSIDELGAPERMELRQTEFWTCVQIIKAIRAVDWQSSAVRSWRSSNAEWQVQHVCARQLCWCSWPDKAAPARIYAEHFFKIEYPREVTLEFWPRVAYADIPSNGGEPRDGANDVEGDFELVLRMFSIEETHMRTDHDHPQPYWFSCVGMSDGWHSVEGWL